MRAHPTKIVSRLENRGGADNAFVRTFKIFRGVFWLFKELGEYSNLTMLLTTYHKAENLGLFQILVRCVWLGQWWTLWVSM